MIHHTACTMLCCSISTNWYLQYKVNLLLKRTLQDMDNTHSHAAVNVLLGKHNVLRACVSS